MRNRLIWIAMLALVTLLGLRARDSVEQYWAGVGKLETGDITGDGKLRLAWKGHIDAPMAQSIRAAFDEHRGEVRTIVLSLDSPGGSIDHGVEVIKLLREIAQTHRLETRVGTDAMCASMCVPVYVQGQRRVAASGARFLFHDVSFRDYFTSEKEAVPAAATARETGRFFARFLENAGISQGWLEKVRGEMAGGRDVWKTAQDLVDENSGIVQEVSE